MGGQRKKKVQSKKSIFSHQVAKKRGRPRKKPAEEEEEEETKSREDNLLDGELPEDTLALHDLCHSKTVSSCHYVTQMVIPPPAQRPSALSKQSLVTNTKRIKFEDEIVFDDNENADNNVNAQS
ncbi:hypothetical protein KEM48_014193 [Puccinia striiformis f. sp. tritici PST-130]|nr:hypothetical protein H4Q26_015735 [Puccinia striiformis f. sp. tritici PST-130]KAI9630265.1 hypothetical protein KEM48_014193 [Puccinia striiformis f. sp. tritici PST-130]